MVVTQYKTRVGGAVKENMDHASARSRSSTR
jgi:hypothetical protein